MVNAEHRSIADHLVRKGPEPAVQRLFLAAAKHTEGYKLDEACRLPVVAGGKRVADRVDPQSVLLVPVACPPVPDRYMIRLLIQCMRPENIRE